MTQPTPILGSNPQPDPLSDEEIADIEEWVGTPESFLLSRIFGAAEQQQHEAKCSAAMRSLIATIRARDARIEALIAALRDTPENHDVFPAEGYRVDQHDPKRCRWCLSRALLPPEPQGEPR